jgi:hypothetical protein
VDPRVLRAWCGAKAPAATTTPAMCVRGEHAAVRARLVADPCQRRARAQAVPSWHDIYPNFRERAVRFMGEIAPRTTATVVPDPGQKLNVVLMSRNEPGRGLRNEVRDEASAWTCVHSTRQALIGSLLRTFWRRL